VVDGGLSWKKRKREGQVVCILNQKVLKKTLCEKFGFLVCFINKVVESEDNWFKCVLYSQ